MKENNWITRKRPPIYESIVIGAIIFYIGFFIIMYYIGSW